MLAGFLKRLRGTGVSPPRRPLIDILWSTIASFLGISALMIMSRPLQLTETDALVVASSLGSSAALIYGVPRAEFSQPRNFVGGHVVSAFVGITIYSLLPNELVLASALAVAMAITAMHLTRTLHPPGAATSMTAVVGSDRIHELGYWFILSPCLSGAIVMLVIALVVNNLSPNPNRHYPSYWW